MNFILISALFLCAGQALAQCDSGRLFHSYQIPDQLDQYTVYDTPGATSGPSNWSITGGGQLSQSSNIYTGSYPDWEGSVAWLDEECWESFRLQVTVSPSDDDQWGLVFAANDVDTGFDGYRLAFSNQLEAGFHLQMAVDGVYTTLESQAGALFTEDTAQLLELEFIPPRIRVTFEGDTLADVDAPLYNEGSIGFWVRGMQGITFDNLYINDNPASTGDAFADAVVSATINPGNTGNDHADPAAMLGAPDGPFCSLGGVCSANPDSSVVVLDMGADDEAITDGPGFDLEVLEIGQYGSGVAEPFEVYLANNPAGPWTFLGIGDGDSFFDLAGSGLCQARYVRLVDLSTETCNTTSHVPGSDIDALIAFYPGTVDLPVPELQIDVVDGLIVLLWNDLDCVMQYTVEKAPIPLGGTPVWSEVYVTDGTAYTELLPQERSGSLYRVIPSGF